MMMVRVHPATVKQLEPVTIAQLSQIIGRHRTTVTKEVQKYGLPIIGVRVDGHHMQHALSAEDAKKFLELRKRDGFR